MPQQDTTQIDGCPRSFKVRHSQGTRRAVSGAPAAYPGERVPTAVGYSGGSEAGNGGKAGGAHILYPSLGPTVEYMGLSAKLLKRQTLNLSLVKHLTE